MTNYDEIKFLKRSPLEYPDDYFVVDIYINEENMIDIFKNNNDPSKPAYYSGLSLYDFNRSIKEKKTHWNDGRFDVLCCECGELGCGGLRAKIKEDEDSITWSDFDLIPLLEDKQVSYKFKKSQYQEALSGI